MTKFKDLLNEQLNNPEVTKEYEALKPEFDVIQAMIDKRKGMAQDDIGKMENIDHFINLPFRMEIVPDKDEGGFIAFYPDLPGCITIGDTVEEAIKNAEDAKKAWWEAVLEYDGLEGLAKGKIAGRIAYEGTLGNMSLEELIQEIHKAPQIINLDIEEIKKRVIPIAVKHGLKAVYLFGSYARGEADEESDVDLLVDRSESLVRTAFDMGELYNDLRESVGKRISLLTTQTLTQENTKQRTPELIENIEREKIVIYDKASSTIHNAKIAKSLFGCLDDNISLEEAIEERLNKI